MLVQAGFKLANEEFRDLKLICVYIAYFVTCLDNGVMTMSKRRLFTYIFACSCFSKSLLNDNDSDSNTDSVSDSDNGNDNDSNTDSGSANDSDNGNGSNNDNDSNNANGSDSDSDNVNDNNNDNDSDKNLLRCEAQDYLSRHKENIFIRIKHWFTFINVYETSI